MSEQIISIGFLALLVIVPVGIVVLIVLNIVRGVRQRSGIAAAAPVWLFAPREDVLGAVAARLAQISMKKMEDPSWSWALISSTEVLGKMHLRAGTAVLMKDAVEPGGSLFFFPKVTILLGPGDPDGAWAREVPDRLQQLTRALAY